jgi:hypothetical protein
MLAILALADGTVFRGRAAIQGWVGGIQHRDDGLKAPDRWSYAGQIVT